MEETQRRKKFKELCTNLRVKGLKKTNSEIDEIMLNLTKKHFQN